MSNDNQTPAYVRTLVPLLVLTLSNWLTKKGLDLDSTLLEWVVSVAVTMAYYRIVRELEKHKAQFGWLLGYAKAPVYSDEPAPSPTEDEHIEAVVVPDEPPIENDFPEVKRAPSKRR